MEDKNKQKIKGYVGEAFSILGTFANQVTRYQINCEDIDQNKNYTPEAKGEAKANMRKTLLTEANQVMDRVQIRLENIQKVHMEMAETMETSPELDSALSILKNGKGLPVKVVDKAWEPFKGYNLVLQLLESTIKESGSIYPLSGIESCIIHPESWKVNMEMKIHMFRCNQDINLRSVTDFAKNFANFCGLMGIEDVKPFADYLSKEDMDAYARLVEASNLDYWKSVAVRHVPEE